MNYILCDFNRAGLLPFTFTRPVADIRIGILTVREKWEKMLDAKTYSLTEDYLSSKFPILKAAENICLNASVLPSANLCAKIKSLGNNQRIVHRNKTVAAWVGQDEIKNDLLTGDFKGYSTIIFEEELITIENCWDLFLKNDKALREDFNLLTKDRVSQKISATNKIAGEQYIFLEEGATVEFAIINATTGPVYIGKDAGVMEGSMIRGPFSLGEHSVLKMGAKIYGATTIGPHSKVGGEVSNSVIFGYSNKAHDGFLGNSVLGEWCNLGADTNNSNLKNNYSTVKVWSYAVNDYVDTGLQFCGLFMGDHSKSGINTMFNTGTVAGVSANIFGGDFPPKHIPSFSWGGGNKFETFKLEKAIELATAVYKRRELKFDSVETDILKYISQLK